MLLTTNDWKQFNAPYEVSSKFQNPKGQVNKYFQFTYQKVPILEKLTVDRMQNLKHEFTLQLKEPVPEGHAWQRKFNASILCKT